MKKEIQNKILTITIILAVILISFFSLTKTSSETDQEVIKCIGEKAILFVQEGCPHCKTQETYFGENLNFLTIVSCTTDWQECIDEEIKGTPSWIIGGKKYTGVQSIEKLRELTGC